MAEQTDLLVEVDEGFEEWYTERIFFICQLVQRQIERLKAWPIVDASDTDSHETGQSCVTSYQGLGPHQETISSLVRKVLSLLKCVVEGGTLPMEAQVRSDEELKDFTDDVESKVSRRSSRFSKTSRLFHKKIMEMVENLREFCKTLSPGSGSSDLDEDAISELAGRSTSHTQDIHQMASFLNEHLTSLCDIHEKGMKMAESLGSAQTQKDCAEQLFHLNEGVKLLAMQHQKIRGDAKASEAEGQLHESEIQSVGILEKNPYVRGNCSSEMSKDTVPQHQVKHKLLHLKPGEFGKETNVSDNFPHVGLHLQQKPLALGMPEGLTVMNVESPIPVNVFTNPEYTSPYQKAENNSKTIRKVSKLNPQKSGEQHVAEHCLEISHPQEQRNKSTVTTVRESQKRPGKREKKKDAMSLGSEPVFKVMPIQDKYNSRRMSAYCQETRTIDSIIQRQSSNEKVCLDDPVSESSMSIGGRDVHISSDLKLDDVESTTSLHSLVTEEVILTEYGSSAISHRSTRIDAEDFDVLGDSLTHTNRHSEIKESHSLSNINALSTGRNILQHPSLDFTGSMMKSRSMTHCQRGTGSNFIQSCHHISFHEMKYLSHRLGFDIKKIILFNLTINVVLHSMPN